MENCCKTCPLVGKNKAVREQCTDRQMSWTCPECGGIGTCPECGGIGIYDVPKKKFHCFDCGYYYEEKTGE